MKIEEMRKIVADYDAGNITEMEAECTSMFKHTREIVECVKKYGKWGTFGSCCCSRHAEEDYFEGNISFKPHQVTITAKKKKPEKEPVPANVQALIAWRDSLALDWWGEELVGHINYQLSRQDPNEVDYIPTEHVPALLLFKEQTDKKKYDWVKTALKQIGSF